MDEVLPRFKIVIKKYEKPFSNSMEKQLEWFCKCFGFYEPIDREKTAFSIFIELVSASHRGELLSSSELARRVNMSRGSVINHLNRLKSSGLVVRSGKYYFPRSKSLFRILKEIEEDIDRFFKRMEETAKMLDREMGVLDE